MIMKKSIFGFMMLVLFLMNSCISTEQFKKNSTKWEKDIAAFEALDRSEKYPENAVLFMGSSSIRLWSTLQEQMKPYSVIQRGFGGSNMADLSMYTKRIVYPHQFQAVVIFVANEITVSPNDRNARETGALYKEVVHSIREKYQKQPIFLIEVTPSRKRWEKWDQIKETNSELKRICTKEKNMYFIETANFYLNEKGLPREELFRDDKLHLNDAGYKIWGDIIKKKLDSLLNN